LFKKERWSGAAKQLLWINRDLEILERAPFPCHWNTF
jgi:hypothetical protein